MRSSIYEIEVKLTNLYVNPSSCAHSASVKMPGLKNKRECMNCHKFFDEK